MARNLGAAVQNHFGAGLMTEATGLNFPPNAAVSSSNVIFTQKMSVMRRPGFNYEYGHNFKSTSFSGNVIQEFLWTGVAGLGTINFVVVQNGNFIYFYQVSQTDSLSSQISTVFFDLEAYNVSGSPLTNTQPCAFAHGKGYLFIAHPYCDPIYVVYDPVAMTLTPTQVQLLQRDFEGVDDGLADTTRPTGGIVSGSTHQYNLFNQGWLESTQATYSGLLTIWTTQVSNTPSNSDYWWGYKNGAGAYAPGAPSSTIAGSQGIGNTLAPKGHFILQAFNKDRDASANTEIGSSIFTTIPVETASYFRPSVVAFYAGRAFYAGVNYQKWTNQIFYSQIIQKDKQIAYCYQNNDPTASDLGVADLLASDGGVLLQPEIGQVYKLFPIAYSLMIFASNGIWSLSGSTGTGFTATDFSVSKVSALGMISPYSFVDVDGVPFWWNYDGIYTLTSTPNSFGQAGIQIASITNLSIKSFFDQIPPASKLYAKGSYNRRLYTIYWLYSSVAPTTVDQQFQYDSVLCFNTLTKAFYTYSIAGFNPGITPTISGAVTIQGLGTTSTTSAIAESAVTKFLTQVGTTLTFSELYDNSYTDWGTNFTSSVIGGYSLDGQAIGEFGTPYLIVYLSNAQASGVSVNANWSFATDATTGKIGVSETYSSEGGRYDYVTFKRKIRGNGKAVQIELTSTPGQFFEAAGWAVEISSNSAP